MSDIVERLRAGWEQFGCLDYGCYVDGDEVDKTMEEAASEIERLRAELTVAEQVGGKLMEERDQLGYEIERLKTELGAYAQINTNANAEIERLREFVKFLNSFRPDAELAKRDAEIERLHLEVLFRDTEVRAKADEIDRLRGLLRDTLDMYKDGPWADAYWIKRVREALGE